VRIGGVIVLVVPLMLGLVVVGVFVLRAWRRQRIHVGADLDCWGALLAFGSQRVEQCGLKRQPSAMTRDALSRRSRSRRDGSKEWASAPIGTTPTTSTSPGAGTGHPTTHPTIGLSERIRGSCPAG
jgi:hypothetical protein